MASSVSKQTQSSARTRSASTQTTFTPLLPSLLPTNSSIIAKPTPTNTKKATPTPKVDPKKTTKTTVYTGPDAILKDIMARQAAQTPKGNDGSNGSGGLSPDGKKPPIWPDSGYRWNLPPHKWSLPVPASRVGGDSLVKNSQVPETWRRGRVWWWVSDPSAYAASTIPKEPLKSRPAAEDHKYGFQFLWNPTEFATAVTLNTEITPTEQDRFVGVAGAFPSAETLSVNIRLDRTNDFACFRGTSSFSYGQNTVNSGLVTPDRIKVADMYQSGIESTNSDPTDTIYQKLLKVLQFGTLADIEYLYKAINGGNWKNVVGQDTSDIGFLSATLLRIQLGPVNYVGYVTQMSINHTAFAPDMTPIRTDVSLAFNLMASAGLASVKAK